MGSRKIYLSRNIEDVEAYYPDDNDSLVWVAASGFWMPVSISGGEAGITDFLDLTDTPASYVTFSGYYVQVKDTEDGLEFSEVSGGGASAFTDLSDVPSAYSGDGGKLVVVKDTEDGLEFVASGAGGGASAFTDLSDVPSSYSGQAGKHTIVNDAEDALEFVTISGGSWEFEDSTETFGIDQDRSTGGSFAYQAQTVWITRPILLTSVLWDIRIADNYTLTVRKADETVLATKYIASVGAASEDEEFALDNNLLLDPGYYRFRMTPDSSQQWYDKNGDENYYFNPFSIVYAVDYGGTEYPLYRAPLKLKFYDSHTIAGDTQIKNVQFAYNSLHTSWMNFPGIVALWNTHYSKAATNSHPNMLPTALTLTGSGGVTRNQTDGVPTWAFASSSSRYLYIVDNTALDFSGIESHVSANDQGMAVGGWFKFTGSGNWGVDYQGLISKFISPANGAYLLALTSAKKVRFYVSDDGSALSNAEAPTVLDPDVWYFIVGTFRTSSGDVEIYVNGNQYTTSTGYASIYNSSQELAIGRYGSSYYFDGRASGVFACGMHISKTVLDYYYNQTKWIFENQSVLGDPP